jgi:hypothetical protein
MTALLIWREFGRVMVRATQRLLHAGPLGIVIGVVAAGATGFSLDRDWSTLAIFHLTAALILGIALAFAVAVTTELLDQVLYRPAAAKAEAARRDPTAV